MDLHHLNGLSRDDLRVWLREALHDRRSLPKLTHDEPPDVALLRVEPTLERITRRDLASACVTLVQDLCGATEDDEDYLRALLGLAVGLGLRDDVAPLLSRTSARAEAFGRRPWTIQRALLEGLINLRSLQPPGFWIAHYERAPGELGLTALAGLLAGSWGAGVQFLPRLDGDETLAFAVATLVEQKLEDLDPSERERSARELGDILPSCTAAIQRALEEVVGPHMAAAPSASPRSAPHSAPRRRDPQLDQAYRSKGILDSDRRRCARLADPNALDAAA